MAGVPKGIWDRADDLESKTLPKTDRLGVGGDDRIELHTVEAEVLGLVNDVFGKGPTHPPTLVLGIDHPPSVGDMITQSWGVCLEVGGGHDVIVGSGHKDGVGWCEPGISSVVLGHTRWIGIGVTRPGNRTENPINVRPVVGGCSSKHLTETLA